MGRSIGRRESYRVAAYGLIGAPDRILLCRLAAFLTKSGPRQWTLPGGGIDFGEPIEAALIREVQEETGLTVEPIHVAFVDDWLYHSPRASVHNVRIVYWADVIEGDLRNEVGGSTDQCEFFDLEAAAQLELVDLARIGLEAVREWRGR